MIYFLGEKRVLFISSKSGNSNKITTTPNSLSNITNIPTSTPGIITPTVPPTSDEQLDTDLQNVESDLNNIDNSLNNIDSGLNDKQTNLN